MDKLRALLERLFVLWQMSLPTHVLSWLMFHLTRIRNKAIKNVLISGFMKLYDIDLSEAEFEQGVSYTDFNHFFTRALKPAARPIDPDPKVLISPVDGMVSELGDVRAGRMIQAKGRDFSVTELLGGSKAAGLFQNGKFCTLYLAPHNYHRIHMPANGRLREWGYAPGRLFSVNARSVRLMSSLFTGNERVMSVWETDFGPIALVMVGALFVGSMETTWAGRITPPHGQKAGLYTPMSPAVLLRGRELGRFNMGSTVILVTAPGMVAWRPQLKAGAAVRMGLALGTLNKIR
jgi:phosphatidylserine decarboxylase